MDLGKQGYSEDSFSCFVNKCKFDNLAYISIERSKPTSSEGLFLTESDNHKIIVNKVVCEVLSAVYDEM